MGLAAEGVTSFPPHERVQREGVQTVSCGKRSVDATAIGYAQPSLAPLILDARRSEVSEHVSPGAPSSTGHYNTRNGPDGAMGCKPTRRHYQSRCNGNGGTAR